MCAFFLAAVSLGDGGMGFLSKAYCVYGGMTAYCPLQDDGPPRTGQVDGFCACLGQVFQVQFGNFGLRQVFQEASYQ